MSILIMHAENLMGVLRLIIEIACSPAPEGHSRWTLRLLEEQAKIVLDVPVSKDTIGRALKKINFDLT